MLSEPTLLAEHHQLDAFTSGEPSLDEWLKRRARGNQVNGSSRTFVVCDEAGAVVAYYSLAAGSIGRTDAPKVLQRNRPNPIPVMILGRLAIHTGYQQQGFGTALLRDAIVRTLHVAGTVGMAALLVHAVSEDARRFYLSRGFLESPLQPMTLVLPLASAQATMDESSPGTNPG